MFTVNKKAPAGGLDFIEPGEIYEMACFTDDQLTVLRELWRMRSGIVADPGTHQGAAIVQFIERKG